MFSLSCKDVGMADCPFVAQGETQEEVMTKIGQHAMQAHGMTEADMTPEKKGQMMTAMKTM